MKMEIRVVMMSVIMGILCGCAPLEYKQADLGIYGGRQGYLDKEIAPNTYVLEVASIGGYNHNIALLRQHWLKRATELCPNGYEGNVETIHPAYAKIEEFVCSQNFCSDYPLVSGVIKCN